MTSLSPTVTSVSAPAASGAAVTVRQHGPRAGPGPPAGLRRQPGAGADRLGLTRTVTVPAKLARICPARQWRGWGGTGGPGRGCQCHSLALCSESLTEPQAP